MDMSKFPSQPAALSLLIVSDSAPDAETMAVRVRQGGYELVQERVRCAAEMREALRRRAWDAVLFGLTGGGLDASRAISLLDEAGAEIPLIVVADAQDDEACAALMRAGARDCLCMGSLARLVPVLERELAHSCERRERRRSEEALQASERRLHEFVHMALEAIFLVDAQGTVAVLNPAAEKMFRCTAARTVGQEIGPLIPPALGQALKRRLAELNARRDQGHGGKLEVTGTRHDGENLAYEMSVTRLPGSGEPLYAVVFNDIALRKRDEERLNLLVNYDPLTALPNRALFHQRLQRALARAQRFNKSLAVLFIDLDRFKNINDTLGHAAGDSVLQAVAAQLAACLRQVDTLARLGGDEFAVLVEEVADTRFVATVARKLVKAVSEQLMLEEHEYHITASIGISTYPADGRDAATLLKNAEIAMYRAKEHGRNTTQFYAPAMNANALARLSLEAGLRHALERREFVLHYQPRVQVGSGRITGMEALVRWNRPGVGLVAPAEFIPLAEETGLIVPIGEWVMKTACERNRAWQADCGPLRVAVNLSARQFSHPGLVSDVARVLDATGLHPESLELEITESMVMNNPERSIQTLRQLKSMGVALAIDDFGTGYSSLGYLKRFPIDNIKIDREFVSDIPASADDMIITRTIIAMAHNLRLKAIAEGVETRAQHDFLLEHGCDEMQGYYFSRPLAEEDFFPLLRSHRLKPALAA